MRLELTARIIVGAVVGVVFGCVGTSGSGVGAGNGGSRWSTVDGGAGGRGGAAGAHGDAGADAGAPCGPVQCAAGLVCCNAACGICTPPGGGCVAGCAVLSPCPETIDQYCQSDASICPSAGVARDWNAAKQQAPSLCRDAHSNVYVEECGGYGILNGGGLDDDTVYYYNLATSQLVRVEHILMGPVVQCFAGIDLPDLSCPPDALPASLCTASDASAD